MGQINLTKFSFDKVCTVSNTVRISYRKQSDPDVAGSYVGCPDATVDENGNIIAPLPYNIATPDTKIVVKAVMLCSGQVITKVFQMCKSPLDGVSATIAAGCAAGYTLSPDGTLCTKAQTQAPTITSSNYCLAPSQLSNYAALGTNIYKPGSPVAMSDSTFASWIDVSMNAVPLWQSNSASNGPMNTDSVWVDDNCDGTKNKTNAGTRVTLSVNLFNNGATRTIYVGVGGDNYLKLVMNDTTILDTTGLGSGQCTFDFTRFNVFPVTYRSGNNIINVVGMGDGTTDDALAMVVYDNTKAQLQAATSESQLNILFRSGSLRGQHIDVASCADGWTLDTSGGQGNYVCRKTDVQSPNAGLITYNFIPDPGYRDDIRIDIYDPADLNTVVATKTVTIASDDPVTGTINVAAFQNYVMKLVAVPCNKVVGTAPVNVPVPTCAQGSAITVSALTKTSAIPYWSNPAGGAPANGYSVTRYKWNGNAYVVDKTETTGGTSVNWTDLVSGTNYRIGVKAVCASSQSGEVTADFRTVYDNVVFIKNLVNNVEGRGANAVIYNETINGITNHDSILVGQQMQYFFTVGGSFTIQFSLNYIATYTNYVLQLVRNGSVIASNSYNSDYSEMLDVSMAYVYAPGDLLQIVQLA